MLFFCHPICCHFFKVNDSHNHNTVTRVSTKHNNTLKIRFTRTTQKTALCKSAKHARNILNIGVKLCKATVQFKKKYKAVLLEAYKT